MEHQELWEEMAEVSAKISDYGQSKPASGARMMQCPDKKVRHPWARKS